MRGDACQVNVDTCKQNNRKITTEKHHTINEDKCQKTQHAMTFNYSPTNI